MALIIEGPLETELDVAAKHRAVSTLDLAKDLIESGLSRVTDPLLQWLDKTEKKSGRHPIRTNWRGGSPKVNYSCVS